MPGVGQMMNVSRRAVMIGTFAGPAAAQASLAANALPTSAAPDELAAKAAGWIATDEHLTALQLRWQHFETLLFDKARQTGMSCEHACQSNLPEAQAMRALDTEMEATRRQLDATAGEISLIPATTISGAIAKLELGLKVQGPFDWQDHALELLEDGIAELRGLLR
jgi:hypothetical protein